MRIKDTPDCEVQQIDDSAIGLPVSVKSGTGTLPVTTPEQRIRLKALHNAVMSYTFEIGIIFHSKLSQMHYCPNASHT